MTGVLVNRFDAVATVTLNRPDRLNALNVPMLDSLLAHLEALAIDIDVRAVVLTGAGRGFCAGGDITTLARAAETPAVDRRRVRPRPLVLRHHRTAS